MGNKVLMKATFIGDAFIDIAVPMQIGKPGDTSYRTLAMSCGGMANVAILASKSGIAARFIGKLGSDSFGFYIKDELKQAHVEDLSIMDKGSLTGICICLNHSDGERTLVAERHANDSLTREDLRNNLEDILDSKILYFSGYSFLSEEVFQSILDITKACHGKCEIWFNPGAPNIIQHFFNNYISKYVDVLILNLDEAKAITGQQQIESIIEELKEIVNSGAVTLGGGGSIVFARNVCEQVEVRRMAKFRDTTGAGDAFAAGFMSGRLRRLSWKKSANIGNQAALAFLEGKKQNE
jgi:sugar/nucleoside kinase (ribokinase family)